MKEIQYKTFSLRTHKKNWQIKKPNVCQFELTFGCGLNCNYCYASCYNKAEYIKKELDTQQVKFILDKVYDSGVIWLCFTGGDPLTRTDFLELYSYAKDKGFIITIFTDGYSLTKKIADYLEKRPPFVIEITINGVTKETYEKISGVEGSYNKAMDGLKMTTERKLPLKIKTQVTKDNLEELPRIKEFVENLGLNFRPSVFLHARLNGDITPCSLRISLQEAVGLNRGRGKNLLKENEGCLSIEAISQSKLYKQDNEVDGSEGISRNNGLNSPNEQNGYLFHCAIGGGDGIHIDPFGNIIPCNCIREPKINLLKEDIEQAQSIILDWVRAKKFTTNSQCRNCPIRESCYNCPGKALLEKRNLEGAVKWFCDLAHSTAKIQEVHTCPENRNSGRRSGG